MRLVTVFCLVALLAGCETRQPATRAEPPVVPAVAERPAPVPAVVPLDTLDYTRPYPEQLGQSHPDTLVLLGPRHYWLQMRQVTDSTKPLDYAPAQVVGKPFAAPSDTAWRAHRIRGYEGTYTFTLRDSTRRRVLFRKQLHKRDFLPTNAGEVLTVSEPEFCYLGYSAGLEALLFVMYTGIPYSDVVDRTALLLDAHTGQLKGQYGIGSASFEATDCYPQVSPTGREVLTCAGELLRAGRPPVSLKRPHAMLQAAHFLTDTTLLVIYQLGDYRPMRLPPPDEPAASAAPAPLPVAGAPTTAEMTQTVMEFTSTPAQRRMPNAFLMGTSGHMLSRFMYTGWELGMSDVLPRYSSPITRTYYLVSEGKYLVLLPKAKPGTVEKLAIKSLLKFRPPQHPQEFKFTLYSEAGNYTFYVDKGNPRAIRYHLAPLGL